VNPLAIAGKILLFLTGENLAMTFVAGENCIKCKYTDCVEVCPVDCFYEGPNMLVINPDECIDCGACIPECPYEAIFTEEETPDNYVAKGGEVQSMPVGTPGFDEPWEGENQYGEPVKVNATRTLEEGEEVDLREDIDPNSDYFTEGMGYAAWD
jgi:ferredoxin